MGSGFGEKRLRCLMLIVSTLIIAACSSQPEVHQLKNIVNNSQQTIAVRQGDTLVINSMRNALQWWQMTPDKNASQHLSFKLYNNKRQHTLTFEKKGEFTVTNTKKHASGQGAQFRRVLTFVVD